MALSGRDGSNKTHKNNINTTIEQNKCSHNTNSQQNAEITSSSTKGLVETTTSW